MKEKDDGLAGNDGRGYVGGAEEASPAALQCVSTAPACTGVETPRVGYWVKPKVPTKCRILAAALTVHCMHGLNDFAPATPRSWRPRGGR